MSNDKIKSEIAESWNHESAFYDSYISHGVQTEDEKKLWKDVFSCSLPQNSSPLRILDVGCGTGAMGLILAEMGHTVIGIDLSEGMMEVGRGKAFKFGLPMTFQNGDAENPPFKDNSFDAVINRHLLWTLPHPDTALKGWYRVLKPGGIVMVIDGVWDDGRTTTAVRRRIGDMFTKIFDHRPHGDKGYTDEVCDALPNRKGVPEEKTRQYLGNAEFTEISAQNLSHIRKNQHRRYKWYQKISPAGSYYLVSGIKGDF